MGLDMRGLWQKKKDGKWKNIKGDFKWLTGNRNSTFFTFLMKYRNEIDKEMERELKPLLFSNCSRENADEFPIEGTGFGSAGYLTLKELKTLLYNLSNLHTDDGDCLLSFIAEILPYIDGDDEADFCDENYRVIFVFDW